MRENNLQAYTIGADAFSNFNNVCRKFGKTYIVIGGETALSVCFDKLMSKVDDSFGLIDKIIYGKECCDATILPIVNKYISAPPDFIVAIGGGKAIDTAKCVAFKLSVPIVTVPTIASTCAACSAVSICYTSDHKFNGFFQLGRPAEHTFIDTEIIAEAPTEFIRAGVGDTLAKFYEVEFSARNTKLSFNDEMGISISRMCNAPLFECSADAIASAEKSEDSAALQRAAQIIIVSTGMVSMFIREELNGAVAHSLFYGLTVLPGFEKNNRHGDVVGYCTAIQLVLDKKTDEAVKVIKLLRAIGIKVGLKERGVDLSRAALKPVLESALNDPDMKLIPYKISEDMLFDAITTTEKL